MTFTYIGDLSTSLDTVRFHIQDTVSGAGVKPASGNFTDEEINGLLSANSNNVDRTITMLFQSLAAAWSRYVDTRVGEVDEKLSKVADSYRKQAADWQSGKMTSASSSVSTFQISLGIDEESPNYSNP